MPGSKISNALESINLNKYPQLDFFPLDLEYAILFAIGLPHINLIHKIKTFGGFAF